MFVYCRNNPIFSLDIKGEKAVPVGAGVQVEVDIGGACVGLEIILYWDVDESNDGAPVIAVYIYGGLSLDANNPYVAAIVGMITDNADLLIGEDGSGACVMALASLLSDTFSVSVSGLLVLGNEDFKSTRDYEKSFTSVGGTWGKAKGSVAYSETCTVVSIGANVIGKPNLLPSWGVSKTYYQQLFSYSI